MREYMLFRTDKVYITDGTVAGTKPLAENSRYVNTGSGLGTDTDITETDGRLTFFRDAGGVKGMDMATGSLHSMPGFNTGNFWPGFSASLPGNQFLLQSPGILYRYAPDQTPVRISDNLGANYDQELVSFSNRVFFGGGDSFGRFVGISDGTETGSSKFYSRNEDGATFNWIRLDQDWIVNGRMIFAAQDNYTRSTGLYATDGTEAGTIRLAENVIPSRHSASELVQFGNRFLISATGDDEVSLWSTDATRTGTMKIADEQSLLNAFVDGMGITLVPDFEPLNKVSGFSSPFVVGSRAYVTANISYHDVADVYYDWMGYPVVPKQDRLAVFDISGGKPVLTRSIDSNLNLIHTGGYFTRSGDNDDIRPSVSASGVMFLFDPTNWTVYATNVTGGDVVAIHKTVNEPFSLQGKHFDLGSHMVFQAGGGSLVSVDLATLKTSFLARDVVGLDDFRVQGDKLYWKDGRGVHVTDGTTDGTRTLARTADGLESSVIGIVPLADGLFGRLVTMGDDIIDLRSSTKNERINAGAGDDWIRTGRGNDALDGGIGADRMEGGRGNDVYYVDNPGDRVIEAAGGGADRVFASVTWTLPNHVETLTLTGSQPINGTGNSGANRLVGNDGANRLRGLAGNDTLDGGKGADRLEGGKGNDTYIVDNARDVVIEAKGSGTDLVRSSVNWTLGPNLENLTLTGTAHNGTGNGAANHIKGNAEANRLEGRGGNDRLEGGAGNDTLLGGAGNDRLLGGAGRDRLEGGAGRDRLDGGAGNDTLIGGAGNDTLLGGNGADRLEGGAGRDLLYGGADAVRDVFVFRNFSDSRPGAANRDQIFNFRPGRDDIDLSALDANSGRRGNQDFDFTGTKAEAHSVWYVKQKGGVLVRADHNGDAKADFEIWVDGIARLGAGDFIF